jgi:broad specificity phosphatase PhoE
MEKTYFWFMRHGQKPSETADDITQFGERQVAASVKEHLRNAGITEVFRSDTVRTQKSMGIATELLDLASSRVDPLVDIQPPDLANLPNFSFLQFERDLQERYGDALTAWHWFESFPPTWMFRGRLQQFMEKRSIAMSRWHPSRSNILIGSHSPFGELAVPDPREARGLGYADIVRYTTELRWLEVDGSVRTELKIKDVKYFDCPLREE